MANGGRPHVVRVPPDLKEFVPDFLARRHADVQRLQQALKQGDYDAIRVTGHNMKGSGAGYGFDAITELGGVLEPAAKNGDASAIRRCADELAAYLNDVEVV